MAIRPFEEHDYDAAVRISNAIFPDQPGTVEEWRYDDEHFDRSRYVLERYVAEDPSTGEVVGLAAVRHIPWNFHPQRFEVNVRVPPDHQRRGIGTRLWERVVQSLEAPRSSSGCGWSTPWTRPGRSRRRSFWVTYAREFQGPKEHELSPRAPKG